jgi:hypothetical protein
LAAALSALRVVVASKFGLGLADGFGQALQF